jgi:hypothetical protein
MTTEPLDADNPDTLPNPLEPDLPDPVPQPQDPNERPIDQPPGGGTPIEEALNEGN